MGVTETLGAWLAAGPRVETTEASGASVQRSQAAAARRGRAAPSVCPCPGSGADLGA